MYDKKSWLHIQIIVKISLNHSIFHAFLPVFITKNISLH